MMHSLPENCTMCGLYRNCSTWKIPSRQDTRTNPAINKNKTILFLGQAPGYWEDQKGRPFEGKSGQFLQQYLDELECNWVLENSIKCYPGRDSAKAGDNKPTKEQLELCSEFVFETIANHNPEVIVCLGKIAMETVLGKDAPKSLRAAYAPRQLADGTWVLCVEHPANHISGRMDLSERYIAVCTQAENLALEREESVPFRWQLITRMDKAWKALGDIHGAPSDIYLDVETGQSNADKRKLTFWHPDACLVSISITFNRSDCAPPVYDTYVFMGETLEDPEFWKEMLNDKIIWAHNTKFDMAVLWRFLRFNPFDVCAGWDDTFGLFYLRNQSKPGNSLKNLAQVHLGAMPWADVVWQKVDEATNAIKLENKIAKKKGLELNDYTPDFRDVQPELVAEYNARDTFWTARLAIEAAPYVQYDDVSPDEVAADEVHWIAHELFTKATYSLARVERHGLPVDTDRLVHLKSAVDAKIEQLRGLLQMQPEVQKVLRGFCKPSYAFVKPDGTGEAMECRWDGAPLNVKSFKFMERIAEVLEFHTGDKTEKSGRLQFSGDILRSLGGVYPEIKDMNKTRANWIYYYLYHIRQNRDLSSKFLTNLMDYTVDGRIHTTYRIGKVESIGRSAGGDLEGGAETGRLSSSNPNLQNIKKDNVLRSCFRAPEGYLLAEADYDRIELVVLAALSGDGALTSDVAPGGDPHTAMGQKIASVLGIEYTEEVRDLAKRVNFGKIYGQTPEALSQMTGINLVDALKIHESFDERYHGVAQYFADIRQAVEDGKFITTPFGRKRTFPLTGNRGMDGHAYRQACNYPIQSVASDITLWKLYEVFEYMDKITNLGGDAGFHPFNIVHDSHWNEIMKSMFGDVKADLTQIMQDMSTLPFDFPLHLGVSWKVGVHLGDMKKVKD